MQLDDLLKVPTPPAWANLHQIKAPDGFDLWCLCQRDGRYRAAVFSDPAEAIALANMIDEQWRIPGTPPMYLNAAVDSAVKALGYHSAFLKLRGRLDLIEVVGSVSALAMVLQAVARVQGKRS